MTTPLPVITNGFRVAHNYKTGDATFTNVYWLLGDSSTDPTTVATTFPDAYSNVGTSFSMLSLHSSDVTFVSTEATALDGVTPSVEVPYPAGVHGGGSSPAAAAQASLVITWESDERGRSNRGRSFLGGCPAGSLETGGARWGTALLTDASDAVSGFFAGLSGIDVGFTLLVVSQHAASGPHHRLVGAGRPRQKLGTQRRRTER